MNAAAVEDFPLKIFSTAFDCPQRGTTVTRWSGLAGENSLKENFQLALRRFNLLAPPYLIFPETRQEEVFPNFLCFIRTG